tara:strand:+ start:1104 stop:1379 length:276 start_codon:yes stop_codon:yes gene_type:complete
MFKRFIEELQNNVKKKPRKLRQNEIFVMKKNKKKMTALDKKFKEHAKHHSKKHISNMKKDMKKGLSFSEAHSNALKKEKKKKIKKIIKNKY